MVLLKDDQLKRNAFLEKLFLFFNKFGNQGDKGLTIILNGKYGSGKTTVFDFIEEKNKTNREYTIIRYNTWENNFFENPMVPILYSLCEFESIDQMIKESAKKLFKKIPTIIAGTAANLCGIDTTSFVESFSFFDEYKSYKDELERFKRSLQEYCSSQKTILLVDELDRCLPEYQIKVLESLYHLLNVPNLIVIIALDREQLELSIKKSFGEKLNVHGYLSKFIDFQIDLPVSNGSEYIQSLVKINNRIENGYGLESDVVLILVEMDFSLRDCMKIIDELNIVCGVHKGMFNRNFIFLVLTIILIKHLDEQIYKKYFVNSMQKSYKKGVIFLDTNYQKFLNDIKGKKIEKLIDFYKRNNRFLPFILYLINWFDNLRNILDEELEKYTGLSKQRIDNLTFDINYMDNNKMMEIISVLNL